MAAPRRPGRHRAVAHTVGVLPPQAPPARVGPRSGRAFLLLAAVAGAVLAPLGSPALAAAAPHHAVTTAAAKARLAVTACPSTYGAGSAPAPRYKDVMRADVNDQLAKAFALYSNSSRSINPVLGPRGWRCHVTIAADGSITLTIYPKSESTPVAQAAASGGTYPPGTALITAATSGGCQECVAQQACAYFPSDLAALGYRATPCNTTPPKKEGGSYVTGSAKRGYGDVWIADPPGVRGTDVGSGGRYTALGALLVSGLKGGGGQDATFSCLLPHNDSLICLTALHRFGATHWGIDGALTPITPQSGPPG